MAKTPKKDPSSPFVKVGDIREVCKLFDLQEKPERSKFDVKGKGEFPMEKVPSILRAGGLIVYSTDEAKIKDELEVLEGKGKPVKIDTICKWWEDNSKFYQRSVEDTDKAIGTLMHQNLINSGPGSTIVMKHLKHLLSEVGDKISLDEFDSIMKDCGGGSSEVNVETLITYLSQEKDPKVE
eukprot:gnl/MRDRNA2_/MRDRNA2_96480_c0_seq1.p1 gnl/MRDRNA2_/MRDRNA2_96480_c0~~gnl/MRDRNA2_/MRDRNA2_96480_c0_seq1.p1  ORF type:complete len:208 (+),score=51.20 gnl/MRDRNA2_/MRDRNA2_96480_c0_seq1:84-626(+)